MDSKQVRRVFLDFFKGKGHEIVSSAPMVVKNDPTLMFTNAGMNQFKDLFLGNKPVVYKRIADTQKCLRVSGKHNDLEEVGHDTYHHTMFEMLGNWSFGDYFKKEAIHWAWELLTDVYGIEKEDLYITVFGGDESENLGVDEEALSIWKEIVPEDRILFGSKKDNFWEMGDVGPCGPCSEIHVDLRSGQEKKKTPGREMVNTGHSLVIEIWNLVFIEFNRKADGRLESLPSKHVDTGMGFERLCMLIQGKTSNYDTDIFQGLISRIAEISGKTYGKQAEEDVAMRVIADHLRAVAFAIADGQLPSNNKAGYVIRRILRRAVRYSFTFLHLHEPVLHRLVPVLAAEMGDAFPELKAQQELITNVIREEEQAFLKTLSQGITRFEQHISSKKKGEGIDGVFAFELFDTFGFPIDLTQLMAREKGLQVDMKGFEDAMKVQKDRSRQAAEVDHSDWIELISNAPESVFVGYDKLSSTANIVKYRQIKTKEKTLYQVVLDQSPFYAESGGQVGDTGFLVSEEGRFEVQNTLKENTLSIHVLSRLPEDTAVQFTAEVNGSARMNTARNHSATHLLHAALKQVLGNHVEQKGSLVDGSRLRFDFAHFAKLSDEEIRKVEHIVNEKVQANLPLQERREILLDDARKMGAVALFGEKYGDKVRVIAFDPEFSIELCGGTHVPATGAIGYFKILSEGAIAAGIRRIEAITGPEALKWIDEQSVVMEQLREILKGNKDLVQAADAMMRQNAELSRQLSALMQEKVVKLKEELLSSVQKMEQVSLIVTKQKMDAAYVKNLAFEVRNAANDIVCVIGSVSDGKPMLTVAISESLAESLKLDAAAIVKDLAREIQGGGGGQKFYATAGGKNPDGLDTALEKVPETLRKFLPEIKQ